ncbi:PLP-dependent aminotransferase family protein [Pedobacter sp. N36a]|uniref:MocR-like pyridoxine biosynthesis transcription factor PdxR n=1 Tax=Pedobacter sp. N36a TaxID=2767996 RepID=UPI0016572201|nr:PLP-dependent aminotransferase family protein [Pedobacter sp. N36a]MBC8984238.1 PLP-dependent aminotransferase family protein [Pedobacter sp. N36a]
MGQMLRPWKTILNIELGTEKAVFQQIADGVIAEILNGRLKAGMSLPGSRILAEDISVNRKTVVLAYEQLIAEGWLETVYKKGTFVSGKLPKQKVGRKQRNEDSISALKNFSFTAYHRGSPAEVLSEVPLIVFNDGLPDVKLAPLDELARAYKRIFQQKARWRMLGYANERGEERLRSAISSMLSMDRALSFNQSQICITRGSQMALYLTAQVLLKAGDFVAIENPGYRPAFDVFQHAGATVIPVGLDEQGINVRQLEEICKLQPIKAVYVTPHHQFPTTRSMKADRRLQLLNLSNHYGFAIVEDDYDHDYHFGSRSLQPLASYSVAHNVIYISSLSKLIAPAVRIGYVAGPEAFIDSLAALRMTIDRQGDPVMENAVAELMEEGLVNKHAKRALGIYRERRTMMAKYLDLYMKGLADYELPEGGLAFWLVFKQPVNTIQLAEQLLKNGVQVISTERFSFDEQPLNALRLGYASLGAEEMERGIRLMAALLIK